MVKKVLIETGAADVQAEALKEKILSTGNELELSENGTVYYVSENGDDQNDALTPQTAIKSFHKIADLPLKDGDSVLFERGGTYRIKDKVFVKTGINYGAYGNGPKPLMLGSLNNYADSSFWTKYCDNIWELDLKDAVVPAAVTLFNNDEYLGEQVFLGIDHLKADGEFYFDTETKKYYLYFSEGNPGEYFNDIEIGTIDFCFRGDGGERVHIDNFEFKYFTMGAVVVGAINKMSVTNCVFGWQGGKLWKVRDNDYIRFGNAIQFWHIANDIVVKNNWIYQVFDAAMTFQGSGETPAVYTNIKFEDNLIEYCSMNIEYWAHNSKKGEPPIINDISIKNNILRFGGYGWGGIYRCYKENQALFLGWLNLYKTQFDNFVIEDNIFDVSDCAIYYTKSPEEQQGFYIRNNTYYRKPASGRHEYTKVLRLYPTEVTNQEELEKTIAIFDKSPKEVKWFDNI